MGHSNTKLMSGMLGVLMVLAGSAVGGSVLIESVEAPSKQKQSAPARKPAAKPAARPAARPASKPAAKPASRPAPRQSSPSRQTAPSRRATPSRSSSPSRSTVPSRQATPTRQAPSSRSQSARTQPARTSPAKSQPTRTAPSRVQPSNSQPSKSQPSKVQPSKTQPAQTQPSHVQPTRVQPSRVQPSRVEPAQVQPRPSNGTGDKPINKPIEKQVNPRPGSGTGPGNGSATGTSSNPGINANGTNSTGVVRRGVSAGQVAPSVKKQGTPGEFSIERARTNFVNRVGGGGKAGVDGRMVDHPDESGGHHDGHHDDHHDDHYGDDWHIDIDINFWSHPTYCPGGWWYVYGDYNNDGYTDYVCTNGSYSVYWYGWSGAYWDCSPWYGWYSNRYSYRWWNYSIPDRYRGVVYGVDTELVDSPGPTQSVAQDVLPEAVPLSAVEVARLEMSLGQPDVAIEAYRAHLSEYPSDWLALRELGLAMIRTGQRGDGVAMIGYAHSQDPLLAYDIIPVELFGGDAHELRDAVVQVVGWGHRNPSSSAWLSVAVLMQGEGRNGPALKMIERAEQLGLDPAIADQMRGALIQR